MNRGLAIDLTLGVYLFALGCLGFSYVLEAVRVFLRARDRVRSAPEPLPESELPHVTVQLPVCNEYYVVERLIDDCCRLDYPRARLQIQVLDDSTDETSKLISDKVRAYVAHGMDITHVRRDTPAGFKAGNLQHGLASAGGEFLAIFDADFSPDHDFLQKTLGHFQQPDVGIVQAGIRHQNRNHSILTRAQDPFGPARRAARQGSSAGHFFNLFGGSAGVVRRACLDDIGGWQADTLTEDEDVSVRAYLGGWRCVRLEEYLAADDVQERMADFKNRVARCNTGPVECYKKHIAAALRSTTLSFAQKLSLLPALHCAWLSLPSVALIALASVPIVALGEPLPRVILALPSAGAVTLLIAIACSRHRASLLATVLLYLGTSFRGGWGTLVGLAGGHGRFDRSTKSGSTTHTIRPDVNRYPIAVSAATFLEGGLALYFLAALVLAFQQDRFWFAPFHLLCALSCGFVFALSVRELQVWRPVPPRQALRS